MCGEQPERAQRRDDDHEDQRQAGEQDVERDLVRRLAALGALDQAIIRSRNDWPGSWVISTTIRSDSTRVPPVTALRSPPDSRITGRRLAGDRRLVDRGDALDHRAVAGDQLAGLDDHDVALGELGGLLGGAVARASRRSPGASSAACRPGRGRDPRRTPRPCWRTRPSATARPRSSNVYQAGSLPPERLAAEHLDEPGDGGDRGADLDDEHHRVADLHARVELDEAVDQRAPDDVAAEQRDRAALGGRAAAAGARRRGVATSCVALQSGRSRARLSSSTLTPGSPENPSPRPPVYLEISAIDGGERQVADGGDAVGLDVGVGDRDVGVDARTPRCRPRRRGPWPRSGRRVVRPVRARCRPGCWPADRLLGGDAVGAEVGERGGGGVVGRHGRRRPRLEVARVGGGDRVAVLSSRGLPFLYDLRRRTAGR